MRGEPDHLQRRATRFENFRRNLENPNREVRDFGGLRFHRGHISRVGTQGRRLSFKELAKPELCAVLSSV